MVKKSLLIVAALFLLALLFSSCKGTQDCPAYSKAESIKVENRV